MKTNFLMNEEHECNWEFQLEHMVSQLVEDSETQNISAINEDERVFSFADSSKGEKTPPSPYRLQDGSYSTLSSSPNTACPKYQRSNVKFSTFTGKAHFKNDFLLKPNSSIKQFPHSSSCLYGYSSYDNSLHSAYQVNKENDIEILLTQIHAQLVQNDQITFEVYQLLKGNFVNIIKSHKGSRLFQSFLKKTQYEIIYMIYQELQYDLIGIIKDLYSNYFFTKFYAFLHKKDRIEIISIISNHFIELSCDSIGAFPIQSIIEQAHTKYEKTLILKLINNNIETLIHDPYGCHVLAKMIECFERNYNESLFTYILNNLQVLTKDQNGICVIKAFISYLSEQSSSQTDLYQKFYNFIISDFTSIVHNQYGNQVIKTIVQLWNIDLIGNLLSIIQSKSIELSIGKFSSTIIETFIEKSPLFLEIYIRTLYNNNLLFEIMKNNFGKYVIQKALKISTGPIHTFLLNYITVNYSRFPDMKILSQWKTILEQYSLII